MAIHEVSSKQPVDNSFSSHPIKESFKKCTQLTEKVTYSDPFRPFAQKLDLQESMRGAPSIVVGAVKDTVCEWYKEWLERKHPYSKLLKSLGTVKNLASTWYRERLGKSNTHTTPL